MSSVNGEWRAVPVEAKQNRVVQDMPSSTISPSTSEKDSLSLHPGKESSNPYQQDDHQIGKGKAREVKADTSDHHISTRHTPAEHTFTTNHLTPHLQGSVTLRSMSQYGSEVTSTRRQLATSPLTTSQTVPLHSRTKPHAPSMPRQHDGHVTTTPVSRLIPSPASHVTSQANHVTSPPTPVESSQTLSPPSHVTSPSSHMTFSPFTPAQKLTLPEVKKTSAYMSAVQKQRVLDDRLIMLLH